MLLSCYTVAGETVTELTPFCTPTEFQTLLTQLTGVHTVNLERFNRQKQGFRLDTCKDRHTRAALAVCISVGADRIMSLSLPIDSNYKTVTALTQLTCLKVGLFSTSQALSYGGILTALRHLEMTSYNATYADLHGLTKLSRLQHLEVSCNLKRAVLSCLTGLTTLRFDGACSAYRGCMARGVASTLRSLSKLETLDLKTCSLSHLQVLVISTMDHISSLAFGSCKFEALKMLCDLKLEYIDCWCKFNKRSCMVTVADRWSCVDGSLRVCTAGSSTVFNVDQDGSLKSSSDLDLEEPLEVSDDGTSSEED